MSAYLELLEKCLLGEIYKDPPMDPWSGVVKDATGKVVEFGKVAGTFYIEPGEYDPMKREKGLDWPATAHTMIGRRRLRQLRAACETAICEEIPGDFIECGVWRGGACILMAGVLQQAHERGLNTTGRRIWVADSFEGLPPPDPRFKADAGDFHHIAGSLLAVGAEQVRENFRAYGLLSESVEFLPGWFKDSLAKAPIKELAVLRLDGDMYGSTIDAIVPLYPKVSPGGFIIVDDYHAVKGCKEAIDDFRDAAGVTEPLVDIDGMGVFWRKGSASEMKLVERREFTDAQGVPTISELYHIKDR